MPIGARPGVMEMKRSPPKDTEAQKDYSQWSLRGENKERSVREGKGSRMGREERMRKEQMDTSQACAPAQGGFLLPKFTSLPPQVKKSLSTPVQHGLIRIFSRCSQYRSG